MALATPECNAPIRKPHCSCAMKRSATRVPVAGLVSVSAVIHSILRPMTPPFALYSSIAKRIPRRSSCPLLPYWPLASQVSPSLIGLPAPCAHTRVCCQGPKNVAAADANPPFTSVRRDTPDASLLRFIVPSSRWPLIYYRKAFHSLRINIPCFL